MPQEFYVLRCFSCDTFQVHIVKKVKKWECKMCGAKQSLKRNYGRGSSKDCRAQVMKLNELRMLKSQIPDDFENDTFDDNLAQIDIPETEQSNVVKKSGLSKWTEFLDEEPEPQQEKYDFDDLFDGKQNESRKRVWNSVDKRKELKDKKKKRKGEENTDNDEEEQNNSFETLNSVENVKLNKSNQKINEDRSFIESKSRVKQSKYSKYLDEDESGSNDDLLGNVRKSSNIFDTDPTDLDSVLNF